MTFTPEEARRYVDVLGGYIIQGGSLTPTESRLLRASRTILEQERKIALLEGLTDDGG